MNTHRVLGFLVVVLLAGCATTGAPMPSSPEPPSARPSWSTAAPGTTPLPPTSPPPGGPNASLSAGRWAAVVADLARRGVDTEAVLVEQVQRVTWNDGSLGCPEPGVMYTQALIDGLWVVVTVAGRQYDYRFGSGDVPTLCVNPPTPLPSGRNS